ncbi:type I restriction enzyme HsdR N-terminal domain-containing protein [Actinobacillus genomosp. 1]|uniref:type I restriction enzyme HsdR N-terminal domain-containing protein n=1 Tax=Actinobacillus genomosp. 1 TaxID=254839 RepID=UPI0024423B4A|nr:type I restriction enzyme HsdR N-terminal domain-containing protein [Actinobacillus genomosp. 1]WGE91951.1 type I restriction enzyme HsdR N-terminal domain-containing protein [Actinobacillus genomosp. 1]
MLIDSEFDIKTALLTNKNLSPLTQIELETITEIQNLDISGFSEADVREEIINPILRILGYKKGQYSSLDREKHLRFFNDEKFKNKFIDYSATLWKESFWIVEAKKPLNQDNFSFEHFQQALIYAIHPEINASIIVLCDGNIFSVFDREENVEVPILSFRIKELVQNIDSLRKILCPEHIWYFYKRKILRSIDKSFEIEFNYNRTEEFLSIINNRFRAKKEHIWQNLRNLKLSKKENEEFIKWLDNSSSDEIIDSQFYWGQSRYHLSQINIRLVNGYLEGENFKIMYKLFSDKPFVINNDFCANSLVFVLDLSKRTNEIYYCPSWLRENEDNLSGKVSIEYLIKRMIHHNLTYFSDENIRKTILLLSSAFLRVSKILAVCLPMNQIAAKHSYLLQRFYETEISWRQITSSIESHLVSNYQIVSLLSTIKYVEHLQGKNERDFKFNTAQQGLIDLWKLEISLLESIPNYKDLEKELNLGEFWEPSHTVTFDYLAHYTVCLLLHDEKWKNYIVNNYKKELTLLNSMNSWAIEKLDYSFPTLSESDKDTLISDRFFFGHKDIYLKLKSFYC